LGGTILVTGANGFVGSHLAEALHEAGSRLRLLVRKGGDHRALEPFRDRLVFGDVRQPGSLLEAVRGTEVVFHVAGITWAARNGDFYRVNADGTGAVVAACRAARPRPRRLVLVSSLAAAGPSPDGRPLTEEAEPRPVNHYGRSKLEGERRALEAAADLEVVIARPPAVYGPRDRDVLFFFRCVERGLLPLVAPPGQLLSLIHVADLAQGLRALGEAPEARGRTYFLTGPADTTLRGFADAIARALGRPYRALPVPRPVRWALGCAGELAGWLWGSARLPTRDRFRMLEQPAWVCSSDRAAREIGFRPRLDPVAGAADTARWYREQGWLGPPRA